MLTRHFVDGDLWWPEGATFPAALNPVEALLANELTNHEIDEDLVTDLVSGVELTVDDARSQLRQLATRVQVLKDLDSATPSSATFSKGRYIPSMAPVEALLRVFGAPRTRPVPLKLGGLLCTIWVDTAAEHALGDLLAALAPTGPAETGGPATAPALRYVAVRLDGEPEHGRWLLLTDQALPVVLTPERDRFISEVSDHLLALGATHSTSDAWFRFSVLTRGNRAILVQAEYLFDRVALNDLLTTSGWVLGSCEYVAIGADGTVRLPRQAREQPGYLPSGVILGFSETSLPPIQQQALAVWACCIHGALGFEPLRLDHETTVDRTVALLSGCPLTGTFGFAAPALMDAVQRLTESGEVT